MSARDQIFALGLGAAVLLVGVAGPFLENEAPPARLYPPASGRSESAIRTGVADEYAAAARSAAATTRPAERRELWIDGHRPAAPLRRWKGILVATREAVGASPDEVIAGYAGSVEYEDGPPFHIFLGASGRLVTTRRWQEQVPVAVPGFAEGIEWLVLAADAGAAPLDLDRAIAVLEESKTTRGGIARIGRAPHGRVD